MGNVSATAILIDELRRCRMTRGLNQEEFGRVISYSGTHVSAIETGTRPPTPEYVRAVDKAMSTGGLFARLLEKLPPLDRTPVWLREWIKIEEQATSLRWYEPSYVPGLLQTEAYARASLWASGMATGEIEAGVKSRIDRQAILNRENPPKLAVVLDANVLTRTTQDSRKMMREQLDHLIAAAGLPHVQIHVVPAEAGLYPGLQGGFALATLSDGLVMGHVDGQVRSQVLSMAGDLANLEATWEFTCRSALPARQSLLLIEEVAKTWT
ncbi:helix-turn-helix transcriptional regulator [Micromonospora sp. NPDC000207]|uniref:helix-turn-helix domain-containing protein n=1 Tax=Micromonospora sp. NPDC000207 TaxID=3154246 RepID=UPI00332F7932